MTPSDKSAPSVAATVVATGTELCTRCGGAFELGSLWNVEGKRLCVTCAGSESLGVEHPPATAAQLGTGLALGLAAAVGGAIAWAFIAVSTGYEIGYAAVGLGALVGFAVRAGAGGAADDRLPRWAVVFSVVGLALAKYVQFAHVAREFAEVTSYVDPLVLRLFAANLGELLGIYDVLWLAFAVGAALRVAGAPARPGQP